MDYRTLARTDIAVATACDFESEFNNGIQTPAPEAGELEEAFQTSRSERKLVEHTSEL